MCSYRRRIETSYVSSSLSHGFSILGGLIARRPYYFIGVPIIISIVLSTGMIRAKINRNYDWLYTTEDGRAAENLKLIKNTFLHNTSSSANSVRSSSLVGPTMIILIAKDRGSLLRDYILDEMVQLESIVLNIEVEWKGTMVNYSSLCGKYEGECVENILSSIAYYHKDLQMGKYNLNYSDQMKHFLPGYHEVPLFIDLLELDEDGWGEDLKALRLVYILDSDDDTKSEVIDMWEDALYQNLSKTTFEHIDFSFINKRVVNAGFEMITKEALPLFSVVLATLMLISVLTCMTDDWVNSKLWLGVASCVSTFMAIASGFGFGFYVGIQYQDFTFEVVYVILATGVSNAFVLISAWRTTNPKDTVPQRMEAVFAERAVSIIEAYLTSFLVCCIGIAVPHPAFHTICSFAACCIFFLFVYQITFFGACVSLDGCREERNIHPITFCVKKQQKTDITETLPGRMQGNTIMAYFKEIFGSLLSYTSVKVIVILAFLTILSTGIWGLIFIKYGNDIDDAQPIGSSATRFSQMSFQNFRYSYPVHVVIDTPLNYANNTVHESIDNCLKRFGSHPNLEDSLFLESWIKYFQAFLLHREIRFLADQFDTSEKRTFLFVLREIFLKKSNFKRFNMDVAFNDNYTDIVASRFLFPMKDIDSFDVQISTIRDVYEISAKSNLPIKVFGAPFYLLDQALAIKSVAIKVVLVAIGLVFLAFFMFNRNKSTLCAFFVILCVMWEMFGFLSLWGVRIDPICLALLLVSYGLLVSYSAHASFSYASNKSCQGIKNVLYESGFPLLQGVLSIIISFLVLFFQSHYITTVAFKILCLSTTLSAFHAIFVIPVFLHLLETYIPKIISAYKIPPINKYFNWLHRRNEAVMDEDSDAFVS